MEGRERERYPDHRRYLAMIPDNATNSTHADSLKGAFASTRRGQCKVRKRTNDRQRRSFHQAEGTGGRVKRNEDFEIYQIFVTSSNLVVQRSHLEQNGSDESSAGRVPVHRHDQGSGPREGNMRIGAVGGGVWCVWMGSMTGTTLVFATTHPSTNHHSHCTCLERGFRRERTCGRGHTPS